MLALFSDLIVSAAFGDNIATLIKSIIGPIFLAVVGIIAMTFLMQRQMMQFLIFIIIAVLIAAIIYVPDMIKNIGNGAGNNLKTTW